jgi:hypothetical protein
MMLKLGPPVKFQSGLINWSYLKKLNMPLLNPLAINSILNEAGITRRPKTEKQELTELLENNNLSADDVLQTMSELMRAADTSSTRLAAAKIAAEMNGMLVTDGVKQIPVVNIVIHDSEFSLNPIIIPRSL